MNKSTAALSDQAKELRRIVEEYKQTSRKTGNLRTITILSGKGGVGKSNLSVNLACSLAEIGKKIILLDADLGLANVDMLCGVTAKYNLAHLIDGSKDLDEILVELARNVWILPGGSGIKELADLDEARLVALIESLGVLEDRADILLIDTGAGIHKGVLTFATAADTALLITTPEPTSIRDAYGVLKILKNSAEGGKRDIAFVVNMASSESEGLEVANRLRMAAAQFLNLSVNYMGYILKDHFVEQAVRIRKPFYQLYPDCPAAECVRNLVRALLGMPPGKAANTNPPRGLKAFFFRLRRGHFMKR
ncbi:MAG: MinD/ParA family protein [Synergistaceae bacterium]|nr:MinD/ParA family protein [Synergistaceae bacterium]